MIHPYKHTTPTRKSIKSLLASMPHPWCCRSLHTVAATHAERCCSRATQASCRTNLQQARQLSQSDGGFAPTQPVALPACRAFFCQPVAAAQTCINLSPMPQPCCRPLLSPLLQRLFPHSTQNVATPMPPCLQHCSWLSPPPTMTRLA